MQEARRTLKARREHDKGDGNFPTPTRLPRDERPEDRLPDDLPKERDPRSAPKGNATAGQNDRNPDLEVRDDYEPTLPRPATGFEDAIVTASEAISPRPKRPARPNARRSSSAKREAAGERKPRPRTKASVRQAPKSAPKSARKAARRKNR
jgi:hypothetical protein